MIDLRDRQPEAEFVFGLPTRCPRCDLPGYLDSIDPARRTQRQHCPSCFHRWEMTEAEIDALASS